MGGEGDSDAHEALPKIGGSRIARSVDREAVKGGPRTQCSVRGGCQVVAGHRAGTVTDSDRNAASPVLRVEKRYERGKDS